MNGSGMWRGFWRLAAGSIPALTLWVPCNACARSCQWTRIQGLMFSELPCLLTACQTASTLLIEVRDKLTINPGCAAIADLSSHMPAVPRQRANLACNPLEWNQQTVWRRAWKFETATCWRCNLVWMTVYGSELEVLSSRISMGLGVSPFDFWASVSIHMRQLSNTTSSTSASAFSRASKANEGS